MDAPVFVGLLTLVAWAVTWRALPWLRAGSYRYPEERGRVIPSHTWTVPASVGVTALVGSVWGERPAHAVVFAAFAVFLVLISAIDLDVQRLPDRWTKPAMVVLPMALGVLAIIDRDHQPWVRSLLAGLALGALYLVLVLVGGGSGMGLGDAKLAPSIGLALGFLSWGHVVLATVVAILLGGAAAGFLLITRRAGRGSHFAFGPAMAAGAVGVLVAPVLARMLSA